jgi:hypothetical protein
LLLLLLLLFVLLFVCFFVFLSRSPKGQWMRMHNFMQFMQRHYIYACGCFLLWSALTDFGLCLPLAHYSIILCDVPHSSICCLPNASPNEWAVGFSVACRFCFCVWCMVCSWVQPARTHAHAQARAQAHAQAHARTRTCALTRARAHTSTHTHMRTRV